MNSQPDLHLSRVYAVTIIVLLTIALLVWLVSQPMLT